MKLPRQTLPAIALISLILAFTKASPAQEKMVFGKIEPGDLTLTHCPSDTSAGAMVLGDIGSTWFDYDPIGGFVMMYERLLRIKIFRKSGYDYASQVIALFHEDNLKEDMMIFKARTYNMEGGQMVETKLKDESVFRESEDIYRDNLRFTFPAVKEGSIIEMKYTIRSPFFGYFRDWTFQYSIPVRWSEYETNIPEFYHYTHQTFGYVPFFINKESSAPNSNTTISFTDNILRLAVKDVPAIREEPFTNSISNYTCRVEYVLHSYQFPGQLYHAINTNWANVASKLMKDEDFGLQLKKRGVVKEFAAAISAEAKTPEEKMLLAFDRIRNRMKWNEHYSKYTSKKLAKSFDEKTGNSADINMLLIVLMRELGLTADPVLLSTRTHGLVMDYTVSLSRMNHVICLVTLGEKSYLLDATQRVLPYTMLPFQCLNGQGLVVLPEKARWIDLLTSEKKNKLVCPKFKISPAGEIEGTMQVTTTGYNARDIRNACALTGKEEYVRTLKTGLKSWEVTDVAFENLDKLTEPLITGYTLKNPDVAQVSGSMIYLNVLANLGQTTNDFVQEKRYSPVDFGCPAKESYVFTYEIPAGYAVESLPENVRLLLPDQAGSYKFMITAEGGRITVNTQLNINKTLFLPADYDTLRNFFTQVIAKQSQQIVLKKA